MAKEREKNPTNEIQFRSRKQQGKETTRHWKACFSSLLLFSFRQKYREDLLFFKMFRSILLLRVTILSNTCKSAENCYISLHSIFNYGVVRARLCVVLVARIPCLKSHKQKRWIKYKVLLKWLKLLLLTHTHTQTHMHACTHLPTF